MCFLTGKRCKKIKIKEAFPVLLTTPRHSFYWFLHLYCEDFCLVVFKWQKTTEQTAFVPDRRISSPNFNWSWLPSYEQFSKSMETPHSIISFDNFKIFFIRSISTCVLLFTSNMTVKPIFGPGGVYSSRDSKHQCLFLCLQIGSEGVSKWPKKL